MRVSSLEFGSLTCIGLFALSLGIINQQEIIQGVSIGIFLSLIFLCLDKIKFQKVENKNEN